MVWSDEPTPRQIGAIGRLVQWVVPTNQVLVNALDYLELTATRREVSEELKRLRELYIDKKLTKDNMFDSPIWEGFHDRG